MWPAQVSKYKNAKELTCAGHIFVTKRECIMLEENSQLSPS